jgi:glyceraldehyde 3-phosphate dehydrogenase
MVRVGINGAAGRVGKLLAYDIANMDDIHLGAINLRGGIERALEEYTSPDPVHGAFDWNVRKNDSRSIMINGERVFVFDYSNPAEIPWDNAEVGIVEECTGNFRTRDGSSKHLGDVVKNVIISCPPKSEGVKTMVMGVNHQEYDPEKHDIISDASCTTKSVAAPIQALLSACIEIYSGQLTTTHAATKSQKILGSLDTILTYKTGAATALSLLFPQFEGKFSAFAYRVPTSNGSFTTLNLVVGGDNLDAGNVNKILYEAGVDPRYAGRIGFFDENNASSRTDIVGNPASAVIVGSKTSYTPIDKDKGLLTLVSGYDNELGSVRDQALLTKYVAEKGLFNR